MQLFTVNHMEIFFQLDINLPLPLDAMENAVAAKPRFSWPKIFQASKHETSTFLTNNINDWQLLGFIQGKKLQQT